MSGNVFCYYLASAADRVEASGGIWERPLPDSPGRTDAAVSDRVAPTYGDYFMAVRRFLEADNYRVVIRVLSRDTGLSYSSDAICGIHIFLIKHGAFYHPCRIEIQGRTFRKDFAVNVAVSEVGKGCIHREFCLLQRLNASVSASFLPMVFDYADIALENHVQFKMFLAEWCEGFHEFHMAFDPESQCFRTHVWDSERRIGFLSPEQTHELYRRIAVILTTYYNPESFEQIFPWHHAAGDFVVSCSGARVDVRLITVRQYAAMYASESTNDDARLEALLLFLVNMSIRTRIDRVDGIGDFIWAEVYVLDATVQGFLECMAERRPEYYQMIRRAVQTLDTGEFCEAVVSSYNPNAPELPMILSHMADHVMQLQEVLAVRL